MKISNDNLLLGEIPVEKIMQEYGSPLYVYEESVLRSQLRELSSGFPKDLVEIHYSMKANSNPTLLRIISEEGFSSSTPDKTTHKSINNACAAAEAQWGRLHLVGVGEAGCAAPRSPWAKLLGVVGAAGAFRIIFRGIPNYLALP